MDLQNLLPYLTITGFIIMTAGYLYSQFKLGGKGVTSEIITTYKIRQDQLEALLKEATVQITQLRLDLATMQGQMVEKDIKLKEFTEIFQGKSPELIQILVEIRDFMKRLESQGSINAKRNRKIDTSTDKGIGKIMKNTKTVEK